MPPHYFSYRFAQSQFASPLYVFYILLTCSLQHKQHRYKTRIALSCIDFHSSTDWLSPRGWGYVRRAVMNGNQTLSDDIDPPLCNYIENIQISFPLNEISVCYKKRKENTERTDISINAHNYNKRHLLQWRSWVCWRHFVTGVQMFNQHQQWWSCSFLAALSTDKKHTQLFWCFLTDSFSFNPVDSSRYRCHHHKKILLVHFTKTISLKSFTNS